MKTLHKEQIPAFGVAFNIQGTAHLGPFQMDCLCPMEKIQHCHH